MTNRKFVLEPGAWTVLAGFVAVEGPEVCGPPGHASSHPWVGRLHSRALYQSMRTLRWNGGAASEPCLRQVSPPPPFEAQHAIACRCSLPNPKPNSPPPASMCALPHPRWTSCVFRTALGAWGTPCWVPAPLLVLQLPAVPRGLGGCCTTSTPKSCAVGAWLTTCWRRPWRGARHQAGRQGQGQQQQWQGQGLGQVAPRRPGACSPAGGCWPPAQGAPSWPCGPACSWCCTPARHPAVMPRLC
jgi:hypothetical protein